MATKNEDRFEELGDDVIEHFKKVYNKKSFAISIGFKYMCDNKLKQVCKVQKLSDMYKFIINKDILVLVNEDLYDKMDDNSLNILFEQELDKITINIETGKITMVKPDIVTFGPIVKKYGADAVLRANQVGVLSSEQEEDMVSNFK